MERRKTMAGMPWHRERQRAAWTWVVSLAIAMALSAALLAAMESRRCPRAWFTGAAYAAVNGAAALWTHGRAVGAAPARFWAWTLGGDTARLVLAGGLLAAHRSLGAESLPALAIAVVTGYLTFMAADVWRMFAASSARGPLHE
jgi:hypothetical protein